MNIVIASNGHKDLLTPVQACQAIADGMKQDGCFLDILPMADGGEGLIEVLTTAFGGKIEHVASHDALFRPRDARLGLLDGGRTAVIEIAEAAGSAILEPHERQTMFATSYGVGELISAALGFGCQRIIVGLGGSIVTDCGLGMAQALGVEFFDQGGKRLEPVCNRGMNALSLMDVADFRLDSLQAGIGSAEIIVVADVETRLLGERGQVATFGPQKGVNSVESAYLERGLTNVASQIRKVTGVNVDVPLAGAAGGLGAGLHGFLGAELRLGAEFVCSELDLEERIRQADLLVVGEGRMDATTLHNKGPYYLARIAQNLNILVIAVVGTVEQRPEIFQGIYSVPAAEGAVLSSVEARKRLSEAARQAINEVRKNFETHQ
jgi:glycerate kinase